MCPASLITSNNHPRLVEAIGEVCSARSTRPTINTQENPSLGRPTH